MYDFAGDYETDFTGEKDVKYSGLIDKYNGHTYLPQWRREEGGGPTTCSNVRFASDGTKFNSYIEPNQTLSFFRKSMCRAMPMVSACGPSVASRGPFGTYAPTARTEQHGR